MQLYIFLFDDSYSKKSLKKAFLEDCGKAGSAGVVIAHCV